jgi:hypothetical protein
VDFLKYLDVAIGLALVMVLVSPLVTAVTQVWMWYRNRRTVFLQQMLQRLLAQIAGPKDGMSPEVALAVAQAVVRHPLLARGPAPNLPNPFPKFPPFKNRHAEVIEREELIRVLLELGAGQGAGSANLSDDAREALRRVLAANGVSDPGDALSKIRDAVQELEQKDPGKAAHVRNSEAIIQGAKSDFVGKINHWFDAAAARSTQQYAAEARAITIVGALLVAIALQFDTLSLLRRLSTDPELRNALVAEARTQQERIDKLNENPPAAPAGGAAVQPPGKPAPQAPPAQSPACGRPADRCGDTKDAIALAAAKRDEIEKNLATLRSPAFSILPDHFVWQRLSKGRVERNPMWTAPYPSNLVLVAGGSTYTIPMRWRRDPLRDMEASIDASGAPVRTFIERRGRNVLIRASEPLELRVEASGHELAVPLAESARAALDAEAWGRALGATTPGTVQLIVDDKAYPLPLRLSDADVLARLAQLVVDAKAGVSVACFDVARKPLKCAGQLPKPVTFLELTAAAPNVREILLLADAQNPFSNLLKDATPAGRAWRVASASLERHRSDSLVVKAFMAGGTYLDHTIPAAETGDRTAHFSDQLARAPLRQAAKLEVVQYPADSLVIVAKRLGPLELRYAAARPETNVLDSYREYAYPILGLFRGAAGPGAILSESSGLGLLLSWVLLSLGAPFWYDMLKNLLKLRPSAAAAEERNRNDRSSQTTPGKP